MRLFILLVIFATALAVPKDRPLKDYVRTSRIVGGSDTSIAEYPYMSNMLYNWYGMMLQVCGGALISINAVLSAANCYVGDVPSEWQVRLGSTMANSGGTIHLVSQLIIHEQYSGVSRIADVAIVRLASNAVLSESVATVPIAGSNLVLGTDTVVRAIGWGTLWNNGPYPENLQHVEVSIIDQDICAERYEGYFNSPPIAADMICAGVLDEGGRDTCTGDAGGPLLLRVGASDVVVGIVSWGRGACGGGYYPGVNVRVSAHTNWIVTNASS